MEVTHKQDRALTLVGFSGLVLVWGSFPVAAKLGVEHAPPLLLSATRFLLAFVVMAGVAMVQRKRLRIPWSHHLQVFVISTLMVGIPGSIFFAATPYTRGNINPLISPAGRGPGSEQDRRAGPGDSGCVISSDLM